MPQSNETPLTGPRTGLKIPVSRASLEVQKGRTVSAIESPEAIIYTDAAGRYLDANDAALQLLGVTLDDLLSSSPGRFAFDQAASS